MKQYTKDDAQAMSHDGLTNALTDCAVAYGGGERGAGLLDTAMNYIAADKNMCLLRDEVVRRLKSPVASYKLCLRVTSDSDHADFKELKFEGTIPFPPWEGLSLYATESEMSAQILIKTISAWEIAPDGGEFSCEAECISDLIAEWLLKCFAARGWEVQKVK